MLPSSLELLRNFYSEGLVDNRTFLSWLVLQMSTCNLAQAGFLVRLADEYLEAVLACRALTRPFIDACLGKITEVLHSATLTVYFMFNHPYQIRASSAKQHLPKLDQALMAFIQVSQHITVGGLHDLMFDYQRAWL